MKLGKQVGLSPRDTVLDGDPAPLPHKVSEHPNKLDLLTEFIGAMFRGLDYSWLGGISVALGVAYPSLIVFAAAFMPDRLESLYSDP